VQLVLNGIVDERDADGQTHHLETVMARGDCRYRQRRSKELAIVNPLPLKFMARFPEEASLEDPDSILVDLWTNLLVSASEDFNPHHTHFISIISRLAPSQGEALKETIGTESLEALEGMVEKMDWTFGSHAVERGLKADAARCVEANEIVDDGSFNEWIERYFDVVGVEMVHAACENTATETLLGR
jgi:hypothetical protein